MAPQADMAALYREVGRGAPPFCASSSRKIASASSGGEVGGGG